MTVFTTAGAKLYIGGQRAQQSADFVVGDFTSETWVEVKDIEGLGSVGDTSEAVKFTAISDARTRNLKGPRDAGNMEVVAGLNVTDPGQIAVIAAEKTVYDYAFKIEMPDLPPLLTGTFTVTIATPGVFSKTAHGLVAGNKVIFSTTGALPTGLTAGTTYYVIAAGLTADAFQVSTTAGGSAVNTSSSQSGVHSLTSVPTGSRRYFIAKVMSAAEVFDQANSVMKQNMTLGVNSNVVRVAPTNS